MLPQAQVPKLDFSIDYEVCFLQGRFQAQRVSFVHRKPSSFQQIVCCPITLHRIGLTVRHGRPDTQKWNIHTHSFL